MTGWVEVTISGLLLETCVNQALSQGIKLKNMRRISGKELLAEVSTRDFKRLRKPLRAAGCKMQIRKRRGAAFAVAAAWRRRALPFSLIICFALMMFASSRVLKISISANADKIPMIEQALEELNAKPGMAIRDLFPRTLAQELMQRVSGLSYVGVKVQGIHVRIEAVDEVKPPPVFDLESKGNVYAALDGIVQSVEVYSGTAAVKKGDTVTRGQILIRGEETLFDGSMRSVKASGHVMASGWAVGESTIAAYEEHAVATGNSRENVSLFFGKNEFYVSKVQNFDEQEVTCEKTPILGLFFPIWMQKETLKEVTMHKTLREIEVLKAESSQIAELLALDKCPPAASIVDKRVEFCMIEGESFVARVTLLLLQDVAQGDGFGLSEE